MTTSTGTTPTNPRCTGFISSLDGYLAEPSRFPDSFYLKRTAEFLRSRTDLEPAEVTVVVDRIASLVRRDCPKDIMTPDARRASVVVEYLSLAADAIVATRGLSGEVGNLMGTWRECSAEVAGNLIRGGYYSQFGALAEVVKRLDNGSEKLWQRASEVDGPGSLPSRPAGEQTDQPEN